MATADALGQVHGQGDTALETSPSRPFLGDESPHSDGLDARQIVHHAHAVSCPVPVVKVTETWTGEPGTGGAVLEAACGSLRTGLDGTRDAPRRLVAVTPAATGARPASPKVEPAQAAIESTWRNDVRIRRAHLSRHTRHTVPLACPAFAWTPLAPGQLALRL